MAVARDMYPKSIVGIDIDPLLISKARKNLHQYANRRVPSAMATPNPGVDPNHVDPSLAVPESSNKTEKLFPQSLPIMFGALDPTKPEEDCAQSPSQAFSCLGKSILFYIPHSLLGEQFTFQHRRDSQFVRNIKI